jgi:hypothetical protein
MKRHLTSLILFAALAIAGPSFAQDAPPPAAAQARPKPMSMNDVRHHIYVMEGALARAVDYGAKMLNREILAVMPGVFMLEGEARARGVFLEGYGIFFDVQVPTMRESMVWSLRMMLDQGDRETQVALSELRKNLQGVTDPNTRASMQKAIAQLERQQGVAMPRQGRDQTVGAATILPDASAAPATGTPAALGPAAAAGIAAPRPAPVPADSMWAMDPDRAYTEAVTKALVDAMIDYSAPMMIAPEHWLTVAARDNEGRDSLAPPDPMYEVVTMIYKLKGSDLMDYRAGRIDKDEMRKRVQITQF